MLEPSDPTLISEVFAMDPLALTKSPEARRTMIEYYRKNRAIWVAQGKRAPKAPAKSATPALSLDDIDL